MGGYDRLNSKLKARAAYFRALSSQRTCLTFESREPGFQTTGPVATGGSSHNQQSAIQVVSKAFVIPLCTRAGTVLFTGRVPLRNRSGAHTAERGRRAHVDFDACPPVRICCAVMGGF